MPQFIQNFKKRMRPNTTLALVRPMQISKQNQIVLSILSIVLWITAFSLWHQADIDKIFQIYHNIWRENDLLVTIFEIITDYGISLILLICGICLYFFNQKENKAEKIQIFFIILCSFGVSTFAKIILKEIFARARPYDQYPDLITFISTSDSYSFPSGHTTCSMALVVPFILFMPHKTTIEKILKTIVIISGLLVAYSRIFLGKHFLSDILAGIATAITFLPLALLIGNFILQKNKVNIEQIRAMGLIWMIIYFGLGISLLFA